MDNWPKRENENIENRKLTKSDPRNPVPAKEKPKKKKKTWKMYTKIIKKKNSCEIEKKK